MYKVCAVKHYSVKLRLNEYHTKQSDVKQITNYIIVISPKIDV